VGKEVGGNEQGCLGDQARKSEGGDQAEGAEEHRAKA